MRTFKFYLPWIIRIIIFLLFVVSAVAKMFPIWAFEKQLVDLGIASWCGAHYLARLLIGFELAIGIAILQPYLLRRIVIPVTIILLVMFCIHLTMEMVKNGAMSGNCGCFGQLIPMTPLEAFVKNIITILMLLYLYRNVKDKPGNLNKFMNLVFIYVVSALALFLFFPFCPCEKALATDNTAIQEDSTSVAPDTINTKSVEKQSESISTKEDTLSEKKEEEKAPPFKKSKFAVYKDFGGKQVNLDEGKKIVCLFVPGCDHCRDAAKEISSMAKNPDFPKVYILFMNEEADKIPEFFKETKSKFPYRVVEIPEFWGLLGNDGNTPGVAYLWNGNIMKFYEGLQQNKFVASGLKKSIEKKYP